MGEITAINGRPYDFNLGAAQMKKPSQWLPFVHPIDERRLGWHTEPYITDHFTQRINRHLTKTALFVAYQGEFLPENLDGIDLSGACLDHAVMSLDGFLKYFRLWDNVTYKDLYFMEDNRIFLAKDLVQLVYEKIGGFHGSFVLPEMLLPE